MIANLTSPFFILWMIKSLYYSLFFLLTLSQSFVVCEWVWGRRYSLNVKRVARVEKASERVKRRTTHIWVVKFHFKVSVELNFSLHKEWKFFIKLTTFTPFQSCFPLKNMLLAFNSLNEWKFTRLHLESTWCAVLGIQLWVLNCWRQMLVREYRFYFFILFNMDNACIFHKSKKHIFSVYGERMSNVNTSRHEKQL